MTLVKMTNMFPTLLGQVTFSFIPLSNWEKKKWLYQVLTYLTINTSDIEALGMWLQMFVLLTLGTYYGLWHTELIFIKPN